MITATDNADNVGSNVAAGVVEAGWVYTLPARCTRFVHCTCDVFYREGCLYIDAPPCKIRHAYAVRISQGGVGV